MTHTVLLLCVLFLNVWTATARCPDGCYCFIDRGRIDCASLTKFPQFDRDTSVYDVSIYASKFPEIPPNAFANLPNVSVINIYQVAIKKISTCAFKDLKNLTAIAIYHANITTIEPAAFENLSFNRNKATLTLYLSFIQTIAPFAFNNIDLQYFSMYEANVSMISPSAFNNMTFKTMEIYSSWIGHVMSGAFGNIDQGSRVNIYKVYLNELDCGTFELLKYVLGKRFQLYEVGFNCNCNLAWLINAAGNGTDLQLDRNTCETPDSLAGRRLSTLNITDVCPTGDIQPCTAASVSYPEKCPVNEGGSGNTRTTPSSGSLPDEVSNSNTSVAISIHMPVLPVLLLTVVSSNL